MLVPIGHDVGALYPEPGTDRHCQQVRAGTDLVELDDTDFTVWLLAHGLADDDRPTRPGVRAGAERLGIGADEADRAMDRFLADDLLAEIEPGGPAAIAFAERHQLFPLTLGLGSAGGQREIGLLNQPVAALSDAIFDLWAWAHLAPHLWAACHDAAEVARRAGATDAAVLDPEQVLAGLLGAVHGLLYTRVAYLDRPRVAR